MFLANFIYIVSHLKPSCSVKYFQSSDVVLVKKENLLKVY